MDEATGEVGPGWDPTLKWQLQAVARAALGGDHRVHHCHRHLQAHRREVEIREPVTGGGRFLGNLQTCGSVWACPVCAAKIQAVRATELRAGIEAWTDRGGTVLLNSLTFRHSRADVLGDILDRFKQAVRRMRQGRRWYRARDALGLVGSVTGYEVTWGQTNGWHPHAHVLLFVEGDVTSDEAREVLWPLWERACVLAGLDVEPWAFDVRDGSGVRKYVTKIGTEYLWNAEHEVVKSHTKRGRHGMTPFDFLRAHLEEPGDGRWLARFAEFAFTFHGRNQLTWTRGLKEQLLGGSGQSDEAVAASIGEVYTVLATITAHDWIALRRAGHHGGTVLQVFDLAGWDGVWRLIEAAREEQNMGRKKPAGAKRAGPSPRRGGGDAFVRRLEQAVPVVTCLQESASEVQLVAHRFLTEAEWTPPLPDDWSVMIGADRESDAAGFCALLVYGLSVSVREMLLTHLERHPKAREWDVHDVWA